MRIKTYTALTMTEALAMVKKELGEDAIIISTQRAPDGEGMRVVAARENMNGDNDIEQALVGQSLSWISSEIRKALEYHGILPHIIEKLMSATRLSNAKEEVLMLSDAIEQFFSFVPLPEGSSLMPFMLAGAPGSGKTNTVAKLAARAHLSGHKVGVITADTIRAGAVAQLSAFTDILEIDLKKAKGAESLGRAARELSGKCDYIFIDSPGVNPFNNNDMTLLQTLSEAASAETIMVMAAGGDASESSEIACAFSEIGAARLIATRLDLARRLGGIFTASFDAGLAFCEVSINPHVSSGLCQINPVSLARLIMPPAAKTRDPQESLFD